MDGKRLYCAGGTAAARYAGEYLRHFYVDLAGRPGSDVGAVLLDVPSFAPDGTLRMGGKCGKSAGAASAGRDGLRRKS